MNTRKQFIREGFGLAAIVAAQSAPAILVRSMAAARNGIMAAKRSGGWVNPYVTDGLVAMWDGEWNAGGGVHNANATTWKDLVGSYDMTLTANGSFGADHLALSNTSAYTSADLPSVAMTIEAVVERSSGHAVIITKAASNGLKRGVFRNLNATEGLGYYFDGNLKPSEIVLCGDEMVSLAGTWDSNSQDVPVSNTYKNGSPNSNTTTHSSNWDSQQFLCVGGNGSTSYKYGFYGKLFALRIYSRALTAAEIAANYAVDKQRFNLP